MSKACADLFAGLECTVIGAADEEVSGIAYRSDRVQPGGRVLLHRGPFGGRAFLRAGRHRPRREGARGGAQGLSGRRHGRDRGGGVRHAQGHGPRRGEPSTTIRRRRSRSWASRHERQDHHDVSGGAHRARLRKRTGVIGTVGTRIGDAQEKTEHTTPESPDLQHLFARMRDARCDVVAMEVSSHALDLSAARGTLRSPSRRSPTSRQDHLDYHHTFDAYFEAKALLFSRDYPPAASSASTTSGAASCCGAALRTGTTW